MRKDNWEDVTESITVYIVAVNDGSYMQPRLYGIYEKYEDAEQVLNRFTSRRCMYNNVYIYESKQMMHIKRDY